MRQQPRKVADPTTPTQSREGFNDLSWTVALCSKIRQLVLLHWPGVAGAEYCPDCQQSEEQQRLVLFRVTTAAAAALSVVELVTAAGVSSRKTSPRHPPRLFHR